MTPSFTPAAMIHASDFDIGRWTFDARAARTVGRFLFSAVLVRGAPSQPLNFSTSQQLS
jgi:hypothetical protein